MKQESVGGGGKQNKMQRGIEEAALFGCIILRQGYLNTDPICYFSSVPVFICPSLYAYPPDLPLGILVSSFTPSDTEVGTIGKKTKTFRGKITVDSMSF